MKIPSSAVSVIGFPVGLLVTSYTIGSDGFPCSVAVCLAGSLKLMGSLKLERTVSPFTLAGVQKGIALTTRTASSGAFPINARF